MKYRTWYWTANLFSFLSTCTSGLCISITVFSVRYNENIVAEESVISGLRFGEVWERGEGERKKKCIEVSRMRMREVASSKRSENTYLALGETNISQLSYRHTLLWDKYVVIIITSRTVVIRILVVICLCQKVLTQVLIQIQIFDVDDIWLNINLVGFLHR